jgi:ribonuclease P protein component|tara:strand:+ start:28522 stop:28869 length:348 start_codon:yes stop_codon:yes gene_type:complete
VFVLNKSSILKRKEDIAFVFKKGRSFSSGPIKVFFLSEPSGSALKVGFSVPKKLIPLAVKRNLIKRRLKEQFRLLPESLFVDVFGKFFIVYTKNSVCESDVISFFLTKALTKMFH